MSSPSAHATRLAGDGRHPEPAHEAFGELESTLSVDAEAGDRYLRAVTGTDVAGLLGRRVPVSRKILWMALCLGVLVGIPYAHPGLARLRVVWPEATSDEVVPPEAAEPMPSVAVGEVKVPGRTDDQQHRAQELDHGAQDSRGPIARPPEQTDGKPVGSESEKAPPRPIDDPSGKALDKLFAKLVRVERREPGAIARILYYGDSIVASDFITGRLRRLLQNRFGDAGHGYALIANAWPGWFHLDVARQASGEWSVSRCVGPYAEDGAYGLGCASFTSRFPNLWTRFGTASAEQWGRAVSRFEIELLRQPGGGAFDILVDGEARGRLETDGASKEVAWHEVRVSDGEHTLELRTADERPVRAFGIRMERDGPGVTLSSCGVTGARARFLDMQDDAHWAKVLAAAKPDLVALAFGSNEITDGTKYPMDQYEQTLGAVMKQVEAAVPGASWMLAGPPDMATKNAAQGHSRPHGYIITMKQKAIAAERGWAFWDQFHAMGGGGSMWGWIKMGLGSTDLFHPTGQGGNVLGKWQYLALMQAYEKYKATHHE